MTTITNVYMCIYIYVERERYRYRYIDIHTYRYVDIRPSQDRGGADPGGERPPLR